MQLRTGCPWQLDLGQCQLFSAVAGNCIFYDRNMLQTPDMQYRQVISYSRVSDSV